MISSRTSACVSLHLALRIFAPLLVYLVATSVHDLPLWDTAKGSSGQPADG